VVSAARTLEATAQPSHRAVERRPPPTRLSNTRLSGGGRGRRCPASGDGAPGPRPLEVDVFQPRRACTGRFPTAVHSRRWALPTWSGFLLEDRSSVSYRHVWALSVTTDAPLILLQTRLRSRGFAVDLVGDREPDGPGLRPRHRHRGIFRAGTPGSCSATPRHSPQRDGAELELRGVVATTADRWVESPATSGDAADRRPLWTRQPEADPSRSRTFTEKHTTYAFRAGTVLFSALAGGLPAAHDRGEDQRGRVRHRRAGRTLCLVGRTSPVAQRSRHPQPARALVEFLTGERSQQLLFERGWFARPGSVYHYQRY